MRQFNIRVSGIVQGVGFRYFTFNLAVSLNITGWVRNLANGDVEILAQGSERALKEFLNKIGSGLKYSTVNHVEVHTQDITQDFKNFTIK